MSRWGVLVKSRCEIEREREREREREGKSIIEACAIIMDVTHPSLGEVESGQIH